MPTISSATPPINSDAHVSHSGIKRLIIISGASRGLGAALAEQSLPLADGLITIARHENPTLAAQTSIKNKYQYIAADLSDASQIDAVCQQLSDYLNCHDFQEYWLINNVGMLDPVAQYDGLAQLQTSALSQTFMLNIVQLMRLTSIFLLATKGKPTKVVNISSGAARHPYPGWAAYCASKAAVDMYSQVAQAESTHAKIVSLAPGVVDTEMQAKIRQSNTKDFPQVERFVQLLKQQQLRSPITTAKAILTYLQSPEFGTNLIEDIRNF